MGKGPDEARVTVELIESDQILAQSSMIQPLYIARLVRLAEQDVAPRITEQVSTGTQLELRSS